MGFHRVIIVDDSKTILMMLGNVLQSVGCEIVATANDGVEGVKAYQEYKPDISFIDINMPNLDGYGTIKEILKINTEAKTIMMTGVGDPFTEGDAMSAGAHAYIEKDISNMTFKANLMGILNNI